MYLLPERRTHAPCYSSPYVTGVRPLHQRTNATHPLARQGLCLTSVLPPAGWTPLGPFHSIPFALANRSCSSSAHKPGRHDHDSTNSVPCHVQCVWLSDDPAARWSNPSGPHTPFLVPHTPQSHSSWCSPVYSTLRWPAVQCTMAAPSTWPA